MNWGETMQLLTVVAAIDGRRIDEATVAAWHGMLGDLDFDECAEAVRRHFARSTDWLMPANVRSIVGVIRESRRPRHESLSLPSRFEADPDRTARIQRGMAKVAAALSMSAAARPRAIEETEKPPPSRSDLIRAAAIRRAVAERGGQRAIEPPPLRDRRKRNGADYGAIDVPDLGPVRVCALCPGESAYTDDPAGYTAHRAVFGHTPTEESAA